MREKTVRILIKALHWMISHVVIQSKNLNENRDKYRETDEAKEKTSTEIKLKWKF